MYVLHMEMNLFSRYQDVVFNEDGVLRKKSWKYFFFSSPCNVFEADS